MLGLTTKQKINIVNEMNFKNDIDERIKKSPTANKCPCLYDKAGKDYKHEDIRKTTWTEIAGRLEIERKSDKVIWVNLKKLLS